MIEEQQTVNRGNSFEFDVKVATLAELWCNWSFIANCISFFFLVLGAILTYTVDSPSLDTLSRYILTFGLFAFSGGITNWLAVKMLFDKVMCLYGSGVIPRRFVEIRSAMKEVIMNNFFHEEHMREFVKENFEDTVDIGQVCNDMIDNPKMSTLLDEKIDEQLRNPMVVMVMGSFGIQNPQLLVPMVKTMLFGFVKEMVPEIQKSIKELMAEKTGDVSMLREKIDKLLEDRLQYLTAEAVKQLMEDVIRRHLHWLVIWGNIFGGFIGLITAFINWPGGRQC